MRDKDLRLIERDLLLSVDAVRRKDVTELVRLMGSVVLSINRYTKDTGVGGLVAARHRINRPSEPVNRRRRFELP